MSQEITINTFNPFSARYPDEKVVSSETLEIIKDLRSKGFIVNILPDDKRKLCYTFRKGAIDYISDPIVIFAASSIWAILLGIVSNRIDHRIQAQSDKRNSLKAAKKKIILHDKSNNGIYSLEGKKLNRKTISDIDEQKSQVISDYLLTMIASPPNLNVRNPIFLEHAYNRIVGWGNVVLRNNTLEMIDCIITEGFIEEDIKSGKIKGMSVAGIAKKSTCSICNSDYVDCNHISGETYDNKLCTNTISKSLLADVSLVKEPINQSCLITILNKMDDD